MRTLLHVDMDAFFASVELLDHPEWRGKPLVVGAGPHERGVVSTCSYEARRFGIHSAMPSRTAYQLCPHAIFTQPRMDLYREISARVFEIFTHYTPDVEGVSVDEAFLDITGSLHLFGNAKSDPARCAVRLGEALRAEIRSSCGVTCSVGLAPNRLLAKIGSEQHKPDGLTLMPFEPDAIAAFLAPKRLGILWGVGEHTAEALRPYGLTTCGDVQRLVRASGTSQLAPILGDAAAAQLADYAFGIADDTVRREPSAEKSVSRECTFDEDEAVRETVWSRLLELVSDVGHRFRFRGETRWARTAKLKLRNADFTTVTRQIPLAPPARDDIAFRSAARQLFDRTWPPLSRHAPVRLIGFGVTNFQSSPDEDAPSLSLFASPDEVLRQKRERLSAALDSLRDRGLMP